MDFSRARTVLIWVFLFLNVFLLYQIWLGEGGGDYLFTGRKEEFSRLETALQEAGFSLEATLPRGGARLSHLVVEPGQFAATEFLQAFWPILAEGETDPPPFLLQENWTEEKVGVKAKTYLCGAYILSVEKEGLMVLEKNKKNALQEEKGTGTETGPVVRDYIRKNPLLQGFIYDYTQNTPQGPLVHYRQEYEGFPLYGGFLEFSLDRGGDFVFSLYSLKPQGFALQSRDVIPPAAALLRFLEAQGGAGEAARNGARKSIVEVALGYYSHSYDAERWEIPPVWRIRLDNGEIFYVNAFTGNLEK